MEHSGWLTSIISTADNDWPILNLMQAVYAVFFFGKKWSEADWRDVTYLVPVLDVEAEVDVEVLVVVVVEDAVGLPGLPPAALEVDPGVVDDPVVVGVQEDGAERHCEDNKNKATLAPLSLLSCNRKMVQKTASKFCPLQFRSFLS